VNKLRALYQIKDLVVKADLIPYLGRNTILLQMKMSRLGWHIIDIIEEAKV